MKTIDPPINPYNAPEYAEHLRRHYFPEVPTLPNIPKCEACGSGDTFAFEAQEGWVVGCLTCGEQQDGPELEGVE